MNEFFTLEYLATFAGMTVAVNLIVQAIKGFFGLQTKWLVLMVALVVQFGVLFFTGRLIPEQAFLGLFNALLIAMTAVGNFSFITDKRQNTEKVNPSAEEAAHDK
ncbi:hypothetical protein OXPF_39180 [Oxobacter pfennigii]|uniref:Holin n=1 Tax=Oxobacter pfennigii TaxID=36849 RepID=A0A0P8W402_9CLOT|nr:hypothetical protein [Oxobacter pfennigii]KPU42139.1 hypothetical protein OXPF_39180 [Oxobacter pfennigii]